MLTAFRAVCNDGNALEPVVRDDDGVSEAEEGPVASFVSEGIPGLSSEALERALPLR